MRNHWYIGELQLVSRAGNFFKRHVRRVLVYWAEVFPNGSWNRGVPIGARARFASLKPDGTGDKSEVFADALCHVGEFVAGGAMRG